MKNRFNILLIILSLLPPLISEGMLQILGMSEMALCILQILDCMWIVALYLLCRQKPSLPMVILAVIYGTVFCSALFHGVIKSAVGNFAGGLAMCLVFDFWLKRDYQIFMKIAQIMLVAVVLGNLATVLIFPEGMYQTAIYSNNWLLGHKNGHFAYTMNALLFTVIQSYRKKGHIGLWDLVLMALCCLSLYLTDALMGLFMTLAFSLLAVVLINRTHRRNVRFLLRLFDLRTMIAGTLVVFFVAILMNRIPGLLSAVTTVSNALGRKTPFNGRLPIWNAAMELIGQSPLLGYGIVPGERFVELSGLQGGTHAHNYILNLLIMGGMVCLMEHVVLYAVTIRRLNQNRHFGSYAMSAVIGLYFFAGITNVNFYSELFNPLFVLAWYVSGNCVAGTNGTVKRIYKWH